jgi:hypothetical protein
MLVLVLFVVLALCSAAGIGGGGLIIPLLLIIDSFPTYYGVPLAVTSVVGGSIVRFGVQVRYHGASRHRVRVGFTPARCWVVYHQAEWKGRLAVAAFMGRKLAWVNVVARLVPSQWPSCCNSRGHQFHSDSAACGKAA